MTSMGQMVRASATLLGRSPLNQLRNSSSVCATARMMQRSLWPKGKACFPDSRNMADCPRRHHALAIDTTGGFTIKQRHRPYAVYLASRLSGFGCYSSYRTEFGDLGSREHDIYLSQWIQPIELSSKGSLGFGCAEWHACVRLAKTPFSRKRPNDRRSFAVPTVPFRETPSGLPAASRQAS